MMVKGTKMSTSHAVRRKACTSLGFSVCPAVTNTYQSAAVYHKSG